MKTTCKCTIAFIAAVISSVSAFASNQTSQVYVRDTWTGPSEICDLYSTIQEKGKSGPTERAKGGAGLFPSFDENGLTDPTANLVATGAMHGTSYTLKRLGKSTQFEVFTPSDDYARTTFEGKSGILEVGWYIQDPGVSYMQLKMANSGFAHLRFVPKGNLSKVRKDLASGTFKIKIVCK